MQKHRLCHGALSWWKTNTSPLLHIVAAALASATHLNSTVQVTVSKQLWLSYTLICRLRSTASIMTLYCDGCRRNTVSVGMLWTGLRLIYVTVCNTSVSLQPVLYLPRYITECRNDQSLGRSSFFCILRICCSSLNAIIWRHTDCSSIPPRPRSSGVHQVATNTRSRLDRYKSVTLLCCQSLKSVISGSTLTLMSPWGPTSLRPSGNVFRRCNRYAVCGVPYHATLCWPWFGVSWSAV